MAVYYTTHGQVSDFLQMDAFSGSTTPTSSQVELLIENNETFIDEYTDHAWSSSRAGTVTKEPLKVQTVASNTIGNRGVIQLDHYPLISLTNLHVWKGGSFVDYVASSDYTAGTFTDPLSGDYWVDSENGKIYLKSYQQFNLNSSATGVKAYATYTYGTASTPADIRKATMLMTAADVVSMFDNSDAQLISSADLKTQAMDILKLRSRQGRIIPIAKVSNRIEIDNSFLRRA
mgnify:CR=1 FL=1|tara:strand:+ start:3350 stop:4045 length:696 start_codon:yes stop_codon:yes gene_type:complete